MLWTDEKSGNEQLSSRRLAVQRFPLGLSTSLLVLADAVEVTWSQMAAEAFQIGNLKVRPSVKEEFRRDQNLSFAIQVYGLSTGAATIETSIASNGVEVRRLVENVQGASNMTMTKTLPLADFDAGDYYIQVTITDTQSGEATSTKGEFRVR